MAVSDLTAERLRELLHYDPETGVFTWLSKYSQNAMVRVGCVAGNLDMDGYLRIYIGRSAHKAHRLAWMYVHGHAAPSILDHINGNRTDNRIANLRSATRSLNSQNRNPRTRSKTKLLGVSVNSAGNFSSRIYVTLAGKKRVIYLGVSTTAEEAHAVYAEAKLLLHPKAWAGEGHGDPYDES